MAQVASFSKQTGGVVMVVDGARKGFTNAIVEYNEDGVNFSLRINGILYSFKSSDTFTINGVAFAGTASQIIDKLRDEVFFLTKIGSVDIVFTDATQGFVLKKPGGGTLKVTATDDNELLYTPGA